MGRALREQRREEENVRIVGSWPHLLALKSWKLREGRSSPNQRHESGRALQSHASTLLGWAGVVALGMHNLSHG